MTDKAEAQLYTPDEWRMALALGRFERKHVGDDLLSEDEFRKLLPEQHLFHRDRSRVALGVRAPAGDAVREALPEKLLWLLRIIDAAGGSMDASESRHSTLNLFCEDAEPTDTFNQAIDRGLTRSTHDSDSDTSTVFLTSAGRAALAALAALDSPSPAVPVGWKLVPMEPTPAMIDVLGLMPWQTMRVARVLQRAGLPVRKRCEDEQAHTLAFLLPFAVEFGSDWWEHARSALIAMDPVKPAAPSSSGGENG